MPSEPRTIVVGLVGGVAGGKSTVAKMLAECGACVTDADVVAREVLEEPELCDKLRARWGDAVFDAEGRPDRTQIAERVFENAEELELLNSWVHPPTRQRMREQIDQAVADGAPMVVVDAPLVIEAGLDAWCDAIVYVEADAARRDARARTDRGWDDDERARREGHQADLQAKRARARHTIDNNGTLEQTRSAVRELYRSLTGTTELPFNRV